MSNLMFSFSLRCIQPGRRQDFDVDPLTEFSNFERGMLQFFQDHDRPVVAEVGEYSVECGLFDDFAHSVLSEWPTGINALACGNRFCLYLVDSFYRITFVPAGTGMTAELRGFVQDRTVELPVSLSQAVSELSSFVHSTVFAARFFEHVRASDAYTFLAPLRSPQVTRLVKEAFGEVGQ